MLKKDTVFVMFLFALFGLTAFMLILIGIKQYRVTADSMNYNYEVRTATSYLREKVAQNDTTGGVSIVDLEDTQALCLSSTINEKEYYTYIYYYDGALRELFVASDAVYSVASGQQIIEVEGLTLSENDHGVIVARITDATGDYTEVLLEKKSQEI